MVYVIKFNFNSEENAKCEVLSERGNARLNEIEVFFIPEIESAAKIRKIAVYIFLIYLQVSELKRFEEE